MADPMIATEGFSYVDPRSGVRRVVSRGNVLPGDDYAVTQSPNSFKRAYEAERGTQAPGERRNLPRRSQHARQRARDAAAAASESRTADDADSDDEAATDDVCDVCGFEAASPRGLSVHQRSHDDG